MAHVIDPDAIYEREQLAGESPMELECETVWRMAACFCGHTCYRCNRPAERLLHRRYLCGEHYLRIWPCPKVYKLWPGRR